MDPTKSHVPVLTCWTTAGVAILRTVVIIPIAVGHAGWGSIVTIVGTITTAGTTPTCQKSMDVPRVGFLNRKRKH